MVNTSRTLKIDGQWNVIHIPNRPNGFAIFVIGDRDQYVNEEGNFWTQNTGRSNMIDCFLENGYMVINSNLYGNHWGMPDSVEYVKQLYHMVLSQEILNDRIHILSEGMGALSAIQFLSRYESAVRSSAFLNPCIDLREYLEQEKKYKLFYKKLLKEVSHAYHVDENRSEEIIEKFNIEDHLTNLPVKIWQKTGETSFPLDKHARKYEESLSKIGNHIEVSIFLKDIGYEIGDSMCKFFNKHETFL